MKIRANLATPLLLLALAMPARAQTSPGPRDPIRDYTTIDNKRAHLQLAADEGDDGTEPCPAGQPCNTVHGPAAISGSRTTTFARVAIAYIRCSASLRNSES